MPERLLLVEDDASYAERLRRNLADDGYEVEHQGDGEAALEALQSRFFDLVLTDIKMPRLDGLGLIERIRGGGLSSVEAETPIVVISSMDDLATGVEAMRLGATDYITKDTSRQEIAMRVRRALERSKLVNENRLLRSQVERRSQRDFGEIVGKSPAIESLRRELEIVSPKAQRVLVTGETGTGKELVAHAIHKLGPAPKGPMIDVNCAALPDENLFLSELFGHEKGAYTGATAQRQGRFEQAEGGTLFLDEIGELPLGAQARILKAIETRTFTRLGGSRRQEVNCRLVFATNRDLKREVAEGNFREDLLYRINVIHLHLPPLRERREDIPPLVSEFLGRFTNEYGMEPLLVEPGAMERLRGYDWPGNIRELRNVMERLVIRTRTDTITAADLGYIGIGEPRMPTGLLELPDDGLDLEEVEKNLVEAALIKCDWSQKEAAQLLNISADRMNARVKKFGFRHPSWRRHK